MFVNVGRYMLKSVQVWMYVCMNVWMYIKMYNYISIFKRLCYSAFFMFKQIKDICFSNCSS